MAADRSPCKDDIIESRGRVEDAKMSKCKIKKILTLQKSYRLFAYRYAVNKNKLYKCFKNCFLIIN